jgi:hypothetical protein
MSRFHIKILYKKQKLVNHKGLLNCFIRSPFLSLSQLITNTKAISWHTSPAIHPISGNIQWIPLMPTHLL